MRLTERHLKNIIKSVIKESQENDENLDFEIEEAEQRLADAQAYLADLKARRAKKGYYEPNIHSSHFNKELAGQLGGIQNRPGSKPIDKLFY